MPAGIGVLSILPQDQVVNVTTEAIYFPIDLIFISSDLTVIDVAENISPGMLVTEETPSRYVLEINAGEAGDIESGDIVNVTIYQSATNNWMTPLVSFAGLVAVGAFMVGTVRAVTQAMLGKPKEEPLLLPQVTVEDGESVPARYRELVGFISEPVPAYSLATVDLVPQVEPKVKERKIDAVLQQLKDGVESIQRSERFRQFLITMSKFHDYSIGNQILIMLQKPGATRVAGFNTWKEMERWVKKGEKGIAILAPIMPPRPTCPECGAKIPKGARFCPRCGEEVEVEEGIEVRYFKVVYVFDISQTEGKPLPEFEVPVLTGEVNEALFTKLLALNENQGVTVSFEAKPELSPDIKGTYVIIAGVPDIWVKPDEPRAQQLKTLLHETAHHYSETVFSIPRRDAETIAESSAFVVGAHHGFDTGVRSFPYVALWAQDKKVLEQNLEAVRRVATTIMEALGETGKIVESPWEKHQKSPAVIPAEPGPPRRRKSELEFFPDSPEFLTQTVDVTGYRGKLNTAFQEALKRVKGMS